MPYACRLSIKSSDECIRDLVFEGYVIPYRINADRIEFGINEWSSGEKRVNVVIGIVSPEYQTMTLGDAFG